jgi:hypothetical protein
MIFGGPATYESRHRQKLRRREVYAAEPMKPAFLWWSESAITFDGSDHPSSISQPGRCPLVVDTIIGMKCLTKVLMDGGSSLNIMYAETLDAMGIERSRIRQFRMLFHGIMPEKQAIPLGQIDLPVTFEDSTNYRMETLTFEVVRFHGSYHAILGRPCYAKFMAIPNYTYLNLKMPGPHGVITAGSSFKCEMESCELTSAVIASEELAVIREETAVEAPDSNQATGSFKPVESVKEVLVDPENFADKKVRIGTALSSK